MSKYGLYLLLIGIVVLVSNAAWSSDWPEFRGHHGDGLAMDAKPPLQWSQTSNVAWKTAIPGRGWSSPALLGGKVYLTAATETKRKEPQELRVICVDGATGAIDWDRTVLQPKQKIVRHPKNSHASSTVAAAGERIYAHFGYLGTVCLDLAGQVLWTNDQLDYDPMHGNGGSPIVVDDKLIFNCDARNDPFVAALDCRTGNVAWRTSRSATTADNLFSFCTPIVVQVEGQTQIISPGSGAVFAYDPNDGRELWRADYGSGYSVTPRPVSGLGLVFVSSGFGDETIYAVRPGGKGNVTQSHIVWKNKGEAPATPSLLLAGRELYYFADNGKASCVDALTGRRYWQKEIAGNYSASPVYADGRIYISNEKGLTTVLAAGGEFKILAENDLGETTYATPALAGKALFIRTESQLYRIESQK